MNDDSFVLPTTPEEIPTLFELLDIQAKYERIKEQRRLTSRRYYNANKDKVRERQRLYYQRNKERYRQNYLRRKSLARA